MSTVVKCYGTASIGRQGQIVIPAEARRDMALDTRDKLLVFGAAHGGGLFLVKADQFEQMMSAWSERLVSLERQARASDADSGNSDADSNGSRP